MDVWRFDMDLDNGNMSFILVLHHGNKSLLLIKVETNDVQRKSIESRLYQDFKKTLGESFVQTLVICIDRKRVFADQKEKRNKDYNDDNLKIVPNLKLSCL